MFSNELKKRVKVNAVCPGWVQTDMGGPDAPRGVARVPIQPYGSLPLRKSPPVNFFATGKRSTGNYIDKL